MIKIEDLKNIKLNALPVYYDKGIKTKVRTLGDPVYTNFPGLNMTEDDKKYGSFTVISIDSFLAYDNIHYLQVEKVFKVFMDSNIKIKYAMVVMI